MTSPWTPFFCEEKVRVAKVLAQMAMLGGGG